MLTADKANHAVYGLLVFLAAALLFGRHAGLAAALAAGLLKETADWWGNRRAARRPARCAQCGCTRRGRDVLARRDVLGRAAADRRVMAFPSPLDVGTVSIARPGRHRRPHSPHRPHSAARSAGPSRAAATPSLRSDPGSSLADGRTTPRPCTLPGTTARRGRTNSSRGAPAPCGLRGRVSHRGRRCMLLLVDGQSVGPPLP